MSKDHGHGHSGASHNVYGAEDFEELDMILAAIDRALDTDGQTNSRA